MSLQQMIIEVKASSSNSYASLVFFLDAPYVDSFASYEQYKRTKGGYI